MQNAVLMKPLLPQARGSFPRTCLRPCRADCTVPPRARLKSVPFCCAEPLIWLHLDQHGWDDLEDDEKPWAMGFMHSHDTGLDMPVYFLHDWAFDHGPRIIVSCQYGMKSKDGGESLSACCVLSIATDGCQAIVLFLVCTEYTEYVLTIRSVRRVLHADDR